MELHGLPQPITGAELVTIYQLQNGQWAACTMPLCDLASLLGSTSWAANLPTVAPATAGVLWNDSGVISLSS